MRMRFLIHQIIGLDRKMKYYIFSHAINALQVLLEKDYKYLEIYNTYLLSCEMNLLEFGHIRIINQNISPTEVNRSINRHTVLLICRYN